MREEIDRSRGFITSAVDNGRNVHLIRQPMADGSTSVVILHDEALRPVALYLLKVVWRRIKSAVKLALEQAAEGHRE
jgi:hypothetical protein